MKSDMDKEKSAELTEPRVLKRRSYRSFRKSQEPFPLDDARRQGNISQLAFLLMGGRDPALAFLNTENTKLGGRPLVIATASADGYAQVAAAIRASVPGAPS